MKWHFNSRGSPLHSMSKITLKTIKNQLFVQQHCNLAHLYENNCGFQKLGKIEGQRSTSRLKGQSQPYYRAILQSLCICLNFIKLRFEKSDGVFPSSDATYLLTRGVENLRDIFGPPAVFMAIFHSGCSLVYIHKARTLLYA